MKRQARPPRCFGRLLYTLFRGQALIAEELLEINISRGLVLRLNRPALLREFLDTGQLRGLNDRFACVGG